VLEIINCNLKVDNQWQKISDNANAHKNQDWNMEILMCWYHVPRTFYMYIVPVVNLFFFRDALITVLETPPFHRRYAHVSIRGNDRIMFDAVI